MRMRHLCKACRRRWPVSTRCWWRCMHCDKYALCTIKAVIGIGRHIFHSALCMSSLLVREALLPIVMGLSLGVRNYCEQTTASLRSLWSRTIFLVCQELLLCQVALFGDLASSLCVRICCHALPGCFGWQSCQQPARSHLLPCFRQVALCGVLASSLCVHICCHATSARWEDRNQRSYMF